MKPLRKYALGLAAAALAVGTVAAPVAAADPRLAFVNGIPGERVDVCVGNNERVSRLRYTRSAQRSIDSGTRTVRFRVASPGNCNGAVIATRTTTFNEDGDYTVVGTRRAPMKVVVFDNLLVGPEPPVGPIAWRAIRHAADVGAVVITAEDVSYEDPETAAFPERWQKGDQELESGAGIDDAELVAAARRSRATPFEGPNQYNYRDGRRTEIILVGTTTRNARFALIDRPTLPAP